MSTRFPTVYDQPIAHETDPEPPDSVRSVGCSELVYRFAAAPSLGKPFIASTTSIRSPVW
jgi:hypothetical protein